MGSEKKTEFVLQTESPKVLPQIQYTNLMFQGFYEVARICGISEITDSSISKRIEFMSKIMINFIVNEDTRKELKEQRKEKIEEAKKLYDSKKLSSAEYNDLLIDIHTDIIGEVMSACDDFLGIVERQAVMPMLNPDIKKELEEEFYGNKEEPKAGDITNDKTCEGQI